MLKRWNGSAWVDVTQVNHILMHPESYAPTNIWNDEGVYDYFYVDFGKSIEDFSAGMAITSLICYDSQEVPITNVEKISPTTIKIHANIDGLILGVTLINKATSLFRFSDGSKIPGFSVMFNVAGLDTVLRGGYFYEKIIVSDIVGLVNESLVTAALTSVESMGVLQDSVLIPRQIQPIDVVDTVTCLLT